MTSGLILVWDLDQTLVGWYSDDAWSADDMKFRLNTRACAVLKEAYLAKKAGVLWTIMMLTNNSHPHEAVDAIEKESEAKFDYIIARNDPLRNKTNAAIKDIETISRVVGYDEDPNKVWIIDDMPHKMVAEGAHWIQIAKQENNPFGSGFSEDPDQTDYSPLQNVINTYLRRRSGKRNTKKRNQKKHQSKNKNKNKNRA